MIKPFGLNHERFLSSGKATFNLLHIEIFKTTYEVDFVSRPYHHLFPIRSLAFQPKSLSCTMRTDNPWKILKSNEIYDNPWIKLTEHQVINPSGGDGIYGEVHFKNLAIGIVVLDSEYNTWLVGQYRFPLKAYSWEIPEGGGPLDIDPVLSAKRELQEETGIQAATISEIQRMHLSNSVSDELAIIYVAQDLEMGNSSPEETEELAIRKLPFEAAYQMVLHGEITDSMSVAGILKTKILIEQGKI